MNLREIEESLDHLDEQLRACRQHGVEEFRQQARRCRERAARIADPVERAIWREAAQRLDHGPTSEVGR